MKTIRHYKCTLALMLLILSIFNGCSKNDDTDQNSVAVTPDLINNLQGDIILLEEPPKSLELNALTNDTKLFVFQERTNYMLNEALKIDLSLSGDFFDDNIIPDEEQTWEMLGPTTIPSGTKVHSFYFHYDNETYDDSFNVQNYFNCIGQYRVNAEVSFDQPILGIIMRASGGEPHLLNSDGILGLSNVDYCEHNATHFPGINIVDGCQSDRFIISADRKTLTVTNNTDIHHDNYRVILQAD